MSKRKHRQPPHLAAHSDQREAFSPESALQRGSNAFKAGRFAEAIAQWERAAKKHPDVIPALAEACFRRAVSPNTPSDQQLRDLLHATTLMPDDACYYYHLGLAHHRRGELDLALTAYRIAYELSPRQRGLPFTLALAKLESDPNVDVSTLAELSEPERETINTLVMLLREDTSFLNRVPESASWFNTLLTKLGGTNPTTALWRGLGYLLAGDETAAQNALNTAARLTPHAEALRHYYLGVIAARRGDYSAALIDWQQARARGLNTAWLGENIAAVYLPKAAAAAEAGNWKAALEQARAVLQINPAMADAVQVCILALDQLAQAAAHAGDWTQAGVHWSEARQIITNAGKGDGTTRMILQNLAIAAEMGEAWEQAADAWRDLLRTKPRGKSSRPIETTDQSPPEGATAKGRKDKKAKDTFTEAQWNWIRRRATQDLQKAGRIGEAITLLKQKVKSSPNDLAGRLELVEALIANQQEMAAGNELRRILEIEPQHREARLKLAEWHAARGEWYAAETELQRLLEQDPANDSVRKQLAHMMLQRGRSFHADGRVAAARQVYQEALAYAQNNAEIYIDLGRADLDLRQREAARQDFEEAYRLGAQQVSTHEQIVRCWAIERNLDEVKKAVARAERELQPNPLFYVHAGLACLQTGATPSRPFKPRRSAGSNQEWEKLGKALVEQGIALKPADAELLRHVVMDSLESHLPVGMPYAERLVKLTPDDPIAWLTLAYLQLFDQKIQESQKSLQQTARLARQQGNRELEQMANQMRRQVSSPLLSVALNMGIPLDALFEQFGHEEELEDEDDEMFWMPRPSRRRRRR